MKTFTIDANNRTSVRTGDVAIPDGAMKFTSEGELAETTKAWPAARLLEVWNRLPNAKPVAKFTDRKTAIRRIWLAMERMDPIARRDTAGKGKVARQEEHAVKTNAARTKTDQIIEALRDPAGATLKQLTALTGWQSHSVRGFLSAHLSKRMGLRVKPFKRDGVRVYGIRP